jgi:NAD-dependent dihydropyrimidine dehydrogenase PreA subunit
LAIDQLDEDMCNGCGTCVDICPEDVIYLDSEAKLAKVKFLEDCIACFACEAYCPMGCIVVSKKRSRDLPYPY